MPASSDLLYRLDTSDCITEVNDAWSVFAVENAGDSLLPPAIIGRSLWDFIADETTRIVYRQIFARVRAERGPVRFPFRCDAPAMRRLLELTIVSQASGSLMLTVRTLRLEPRPAVPLLDPKVARSDDIVVICAWCKRVRDSSGEWVEVERAVQRLEIFHEPTLPALSHGVCEACLRSMTEDLDEPEVTVAWSS